MLKFLNGLKDLDKNIIKIMKYGLIFSSIVCLVATFILLSYMHFNINSYYYLGLGFIKSGIIFAVEFIVCGIVVDFIRKHQYI